MFYKTIVSIVGAFLLTLPQLLNASVTVDPWGIATSFSEGDEGAIEITIAPEADSALIFEIDYELVSFTPYGNDAPRRDDRGDEIEDKAFELEEGADTYKSLAWDYNNELMLVSCYYNGTLSAYDPRNGERVALYEGLDYPMDIAYLDGVVFTPVLGDSTLQRLIMNEYGEFENIGDIFFPGRIYGIAADHENHWLIILNRDNHYYLEIWSVTDDNELDERIAVITNLNTNGFFTIYNLEWVPAHREIGQLWAHLRTTMYQVLVNEDEWECKDINDEYGSFQVASTYDYEGAAHDGTDIWVTGYNQSGVQAYDDGITEHQWLIIDPTEGSVDPDDEFDLFWLFDFGNAPAGTYRYVIAINTSIDSVIFSMIFHVEAPAAFVRGGVRSSEVGNALGGAELSLDGYNLRRWSNEDGGFHIGYLAPGDYALTVTHTDCYQTSHEFTVTENDDELILHVDLTALQAPEEDNTHPVDFGIVNAYPNPFNSSLHLEYRLPQAGTVEIALFDLQGRMVRSVYEGYAGFGHHTVQVDGSSLASGVYILRVNADMNISLQKVALIR
ncbi:T9SS type A sorting domain-containing protein [Calditrichota bacterium]